MDILVRFILVNKEITPWYSFYTQEGANNFIKVFRKTFKVLKVEKRVINTDDNVKEVNE